MNEKETSELEKQIKTISEQFEEVKNYAIKEQKRCDFLVDIVKQITDKVNNAIIKKQTSINIQELINVLAKLKEIN